MIDLSMSGRTVVVTGGSAGIGNGIARIFAAQGAAVHVTGTRARADEYDGVDGSDLDGLQYHRLDVTQADDVRDFLVGTSVDVLVNSVGTVAYGRAEYDPAIFERVVDVNLNGIMRCCVRFRPELAAAGGAIVNVASTSSFIATPGQPAYSASKGGLVTLTRSLADAWAVEGIRVNAVAPGLVATRLTRVSREREQVYEESIRSIPLRRWGTPAEMGSVALFLASPLASYITGQVVVVDGGLTLR
ncbi:MAG: SDR family oxidoreductase [Pseudonocardia sp.]|uniref:SDR family NAD(P)-dependent oxidoreductase n=1 Tax=unclassified Pseudonocardia TaxID=2619320 RepID=UPI0008692FD2|nr:MULTISPECIES: SDR family oxidoreductase [unclassified Pseudonocardia]MBN9112442.1 SDR family oxidoreductase [Pseudonocardia sp.]ODU27375.1 MAG: 3-oxoacyl-ACP reductase [Pseudonocardia sp. SCN 72-51]ODV09019.1 MAG: 3-oxoacyl-ACP reductase [Pseudonocardia sp. SCN 73-27]